MTKTISVLAALLLILTLLSSCEKCFTCTNTCYTCLLRDSMGMTVDSKHLCSDTLIYKSLTDSLTVHGYACTKTASTYNDQWCVNQKDGVGQYLPYHQGNGRYTCVQK